MRAMEEQVGRLFMIGLPGPALDDDAKRVLDAVRPLSVILFGRNIEGKEQLATLLRHITAFLGYKPLFAIDQEGGVVTRLAGDFTVMPGPMALAATGDPRCAYEAALVLGGEMKALGIDWNLAPVVDINCQPENRGIGIRSFGAHRSSVTTYAAPFLAGLKKSGVHSCLKHFPGLGGVRRDPHLGLPRLEADQTTIKNRELYPFLQLESDCWMPTHLYVPALQTRKEPASLSEEILTDLVRRRLGFRGLLVADDLNMAGIAQCDSPDRIASRSFRAGMDILAFCEGSRKQIETKQSLEKAICRDEVLQQRLTQSLRRIDRVFGQPEQKITQDLSSVGTQVNREKSVEIASGTIQVLKGDHALPPLHSMDKIFAMRPSRLVLIENHREGFPAIAIKAARSRDCPLMEIPRSPSPSEKERLIQEADGATIMMITENAHLEPDLSAIITEMAKRSESHLLLALRNPYDADIPGVRNAVGSYGYTEPQQNALWERLRDSTL